MPGMFSAAPADDDSCAAEQEDQPGEDADPAGIFMRALGTERNDARRGHNIESAHGRRDEPDQVTR